VKIDPDIQALDIKETDKMDMQIKRDEKEVDDFFEKAIKEIHAVNLDAVKALGEYLERQGKDQIATKIIKDFKKHIPMEEVLRCIKEFDKTHWLE
jgi:hypothetical protein